MRRGTGGNQFVDADATALEVVALIAKQLAELDRYAADSGREFDIGAISVDTKRMANGRISVDVGADLRNTS